jgi:FKBP-type peptidyl-prolyl cis-trans isomerase FklB
MKSRFAIILCMVLAASPVLAAEKRELKTEKQKASYAIGFDMGSSLKENGLDIDADILVKALRDALSGSTALMTEQEVKATLMAVRKDLQARQQEKTKISGEKNKKEGEDFLARNKTKDEIKTLASGLQYKVLTEGKGKSPKAGDTVTVNYRGMFIDGTEFDSSYKRGQPANFTVGSVIKGWTEALQLMKEGSQWQLFVPANLAYGDNGTPGGPIGPNAALIFDMELISVKAPSAPQHHH